MKNIIPYEKDIEFDTKIAEITSISLEHEETTNGNEITGEFIISGDYKAHQISVNKEDFMYKIPFTIELSDNIDRNSVNIDINDFTYDIKDNKILSLKIELAFDYNEIEEVKEAEVIEKTQVDEIEENTSEEQREEELDREIEEMITKNDDDLETNTKIINSMTSENTYVTYHVYVVNSDDTIESICQKFNVSKEALHEYNEFESINVGDKLLIPLEDE